MNPLRSRAHGPRDTPETTIGTPDLYWITLDVPGRLAIAARPRGGDWLGDELDGWRRAGVGTVVSLLTPDEESELGLAGEQTGCVERGIHFTALPVGDRGTPNDRDAWDDAVGEAVATVLVGGTVAVHCRQGIGRSVLFAAAVLKALGLPTDAALARVAAARGRPVPETPEQAAWIARHTPAAPVGSGTP